MTAMECIRTEEKILKVDALMHCAQVTSGDPLQPTEYACEAHTSPKVSMGNSPRNECQYVLTYGRLQHSARSVIPIKNDKKYHVTAA